MVKKTTLKLKLKKHQMYQIGFTILSVIVTIVIPLVNFFNFKNSIRTFDCPVCSESVVNQIYLGGLETIYDILIYIFVLLGFIVSICTYFIHKFQKYSIQRGILVLLISIVYMINSIFSSQMSTIIIRVANVQLIMNSSGVYILFIAVASLYVIKALFDLIDFKINHSYYSSILRNRREARFKQQKLTNCPKCEYACRIGWKKCPISKTKI